MLVSEFDYELPAALIAQHPVPQRSASRLLRLDARNGALQDLKFTDLPNLVGPDDVLVLNDTRVIKARLACRKASDRAAGSVLASDAFFPFPDGVERAAESGITAVIQPGGSIRDEQVIEAANRHHMAMILTHQRHFRH